MIRTFNDYYAKAHGSLPAYEELGRRCAFYVQPKEQDFEVYLNKPVVKKLSPISKLFLQRVTKVTSSLEKLEVLLTAAVFRDGPKLFQPGDLLRGLAKQPVVEEYSQPFHTMVIEVPPAIIERHPVLVILHQQLVPVPMLVTNVVMNDGNAMKTWWSNGPLENWFNGEWGDLRRACANFAVLASKSHLEAVPSARLTKLRKLVAKKNEHLEANKLRLRTCPVYWRLT